MQDQDLSTGVLRAQSLFKLDDHFTLHSLTIFSISIYFI